MSKRTVWSALLTFFVAAALGMELWGAFDSSPDTTTITELTVRFVPAAVTTVVIGALVHWLPGHFAHAYGTDGGTVKGFKFQPVAWLTTASAILGAATTISVTPPFSQHIPDSVTAWLGGATVVVTTVLGVLAHNRVTPLAAPRDNEGRVLVAAPQPVSADKTGL